MFKFHHAGFIVKDITSWEKNLFIEKKMADIIDPVQEARLSLYKQFGEDHFIELIQPLNEKAFTWNALKKKGNHFHHFCYSIGSINELNEITLSYKMIPVLGPVKAVLFHERNVVFYYNRNKEIIEFLIEKDET
ncbi:MAG: VOC family protein [Ferruginibacter sp.]